MQIKPSALKKVDALFKTYDKPDVPGCAVGIIHKGKFIYKKGFGSANLEYTIPITPSTVFDIASVSKQFTAACALLLEYQGKLSLEDDIGNYLPELPYKQKITLLHLIYHTSGIPDYCELMGLAGMPFYNDYPAAQIIELIARQPLNFKPGEEQLYSNSGYFLLAEIIARVSGKSLNAFASEHIFKPLKMKHTQFYDDHTRIIKNRAIGYSPTEKGFAIEHYKLDVVGDGAVHTTVEDLFLWDKNFYKNKLMGGQKFINRLLTLGKLNSGESTQYAFGLGLVKFRGQQLVTHSGGWGGYLSDFVRIPEHKLSLIILSNTNDPSVLKGSKIIELLLANVLDSPKPQVQQPEAPLAKPFKMSPRTLKKYQGNYYNKQLNVTYTLICKDKQLVLKFPYTKEGFELQAFEFDKFKHEDGLELHFGRNSQDQVTGFIVPGHRAKSIKFKKSKTA